MHLVIARHRYEVEQAVNLLKGAASRELEAEGLHPLRSFPRPDGSLPSPWGSKCWKVFLDSQEGIVRSIDYANDNPTRDGMKRQSWSCVTAYAQYGRIPICPSGRR